MVVIGLLNCVVNIFGISYLLQKNQTKLAMLLAGVVLPVLALSYELLWHPLGGYVVNVIPTLWHVGLIALVPAANFLCIIQILSGRIRCPAAFSILNGMVLATCIPHALLCVPLGGILFIGLFIGVAAVVISPLTALIATDAIWRLGISEFGRRQDCRLSPKHRKIGIMVTIFILAIAHFPVFFTKNLAVIATHSPYREQAITALRYCADRNELLRLCYQGEYGLRTTDAFTWTISVQEAKALVLSVTGKDFTYFKQPTPQSWERGFD